MTNVDLERIANATAYDSTGDKLGKVGQIYLDDETGQPTFVSVATGLFGTSESLVPVDGHSWNGDDLVLAYEKDVVKGAPNVDADRHISEQEQDELYAYYGGLKGARTTDRDRTVGAAGVDRDRGRDVVDRDRDRDRVGVADEAAVTRSEERLNVGKEQVETGRVRLRKYTTTENQQVTVPVEKEKVVVERTPVEGGRVGGTIDNDGEVVEEITTREERPVVEKEAVEVEQVRLGKETVTENETVSGEVRKEHIDIDTQGDVTDRVGDRGADGRGVGDRVKDKLDRDNDGRIG